jgi:hypothetical protein
MGKLVWVFKVRGDILQQQGTSFPVSSARLLLCSRPNQLLGSVLVASLNVLAGNKAAQPVRHLFFCLPLKTEPILQDAV